MIHLTDAAQKQISKLCEDGYNVGIRLEVVSGGCSGFQYKFTEAGRMTTDEEKEIMFGVYGSALFIDHASAEKLDGSTIDYVSDIMSEQFVINNPNSDCCGCGKSFT